MTKYGIKSLFYHKNLSEPDTQYVFALTAYNEAEGEVGNYFGTHFLSSKNSSG
jgi:hypothetical protein